METDEKPATFMVGKMVLAEIPTRPGKVWLYMPGEEGLECEEAKLEEHLLAFFRENF